MAFKVVLDANVLYPFSLRARHFPAAALAPFGKQQIDPDGFLCTLLDIDGPTVADTIIEQAADLKRPPLTPAQLLDLLQLSRVVRFAGRMREVLDLPPWTDAEILAARVP